MKNAFSTAWKSSVQPRKQRKYLFNLPMHLQNKVISAPLSKELREKHGTRATRIRLGDKVRVMRGTHKGKEGKVELVDLRNNKVFVMKVEHLKKEGGRSPYPLSPSNLMITELVSDKRRLKKSSTQSSKPAKAEKTKSVEKVVKTETTKKEE
ncbi:50S ribosomal protein L24 [Candidatus Woesearchaeota archaeon]|nr:50S ribosomal protein L24 [Candidatus Woesearchaeota archaeon]